MRTMMICGLVLAAAVARGAADTASRVEADFTGTQAVAVHYAVPAMSERQRLPTAYPEDGTRGGTVNIVVARDEYESGSFLIWPRRDLGKVELELGEFKQVEGQRSEVRQGTVFPKSDLDLKVVKVWYQNGNAWFSYFGDTGLKLVPELLLHDEDLVRVDTKRKSNYARLVDAKGARSEFWLNPPREMSRRKLQDAWVEVDRFEPMRGDFNDAATLQPVALPKGAFKQFFLTVHAKRSAKPGLYRGEIRILGQGERSRSTADGKAPLSTSASTCLATIPVALRVLDFELPQPKCRLDPKKDFFVSFYECASLRSVMALNGGDLDRAKRQLVNIMRNQVAHNHTIHWINANMSNEAFVTLDLMKEAGKRTDVYIAGFNPHWIDKDPKTRPRRIVGELDRRFGHHNVYCGYGDEPTANWLVQARPELEAYQREGLKFIIAGSDKVFNLAGYLYDWHIVAREATDGRSLALWNALQSDNHVAWYANQHVGSENPAFNRRQNGLAAYLTGYTALCNYEDALGPWNDLSVGYRPMAYSYACGDGVVDTLQWEGFREGLDDIRYATLLTDLARTAQKSEDVSVRYLGGQAMQFLAELNPAAYDADMVRAEMIERIGKLLAVAKPSKFETSVVIDRAAAKRSAAQAEESLKREVDAALAKLKNAKTAAETNGVHYAVAGAYKRHFRLEEAGDYLVRAGLPAGAVAHDHVTGAPYAYLPEKNTAAQWAALKNQNSPDAFYALLPGHPEILDAYYERIVLRNAKPANTNAVRNAIGDVFAKLGKRRLYMGDQRFFASTSLYAKTLSWARKYGVGVPEDTARNVFEAYAVIGNDRGAAEVAREGLKIKGQKANMRVFFTLGEKLSGYRGDEKGAEALVKRTIEGLKDVKNGDVAGALQALGSIFYGARRESVVRGLEAFRRSLYKPVPKKRYVVKFSDEPIMGLTDLERLSLEEAVYDRSFGGSLEFLETDVTSGNRGSVGSSKDKLAPPRMKIAADARGIHVLVTVKDPKARDVELGTVGDCSFEGYVAPGDNTPYICVMAETRKAVCTVFNTTYDTIGAQRVPPQGDPKRLRFDRLFRENEIVCYFFYAWENWATRIPKDGEVWNYENMYWYRGGNFCWNGTESIHGRSTWGELQFVLTDAQRVMILRPLLADAFAHYKAEKYIGGATSVGRCQDATLGDKAFYAAEIAPLVKKLDSLGELFRGDMAPSTVLWLECEALPKWHDIEFEVARRRARYLECNQCSLK